MYLWRLLFVFLMLELSGCNTQIYDPHYWHTGFVAMLHSKEREKFGDVRGIAGFAIEEASVGNSTLHNGNITYKYRYQGTCRYTLEVDPKTDIIVATSWEGDERDCAIVP
jgi:hypothetical protein